MTLAEVYEKYKHLDSAFSESYGTFETRVIQDLWLAIKAEVGASKKERNQ